MKTKLQIHNERVVKRLFRVRALCPTWRRRHVSGRHGKNASPHIQLRVIGLRGQNIYTCAGGGYVVV